MRGQRQILLCRSAAGQHRRRPRFEQRAHLFGVEVVHVLVAVDIARNGGQTRAVDDGQPLRVCRTGTHRSNLAAPNHNRARLDHGTGPHHDPDVRDRDVLSVRNSRERQQSRRQTGQH